VFLEKRLQALENKGRAREKGGKEKHKRLQAKENERDRSGTVRNKGGPAAIKWSRGPHHTQRPAVALGIVFAKRVWICLIAKALHLLAVQKSL
jgi:hypothetical protein